MIPQMTIPDRSEHEQFSPAMVYVRQPARWEYRRLVRDLDDGDAFTEEELNALGAEGWELVSVTALPIQLHAYFKRLKK
jgi:hypothetical protein